MRLLSTINFIRFKILYISSKYRWLERNLSGKDRETTYEHLIGMVSNELRNYCYKYGKEIYTGEGALIDLGSWLGSSVIPLASGLKENPLANNAKIHAYDAFVWYDNMTYSAKDTSIKNKYKTGDDFLPEFEAQTHPYRDYIITHKGDLRNVEWNGEAIEYLFIDAMKDWDVTLQILNTFYTKLIPGKSIIIHEDFCHHYTSWIHIIHYRLSDYFTPTNALKNSSEMMFLNTKPLPNLEHFFPEQFEKISQEEIEAAFNYSLSLVDKSNKPAILAAKAMAYRHIENYTKAKETLAQIPFIYKHLNREVFDARMQIHRESKD